MRQAVLFVCLGNICRSPLAEAAFRREAERAGLDVLVDSAGTGDWHVGQPPDPRAIELARRHGIDIGSFRGRQIAVDDFTRFSHIFAMDHDNLANVLAGAPKRATAEISLLLDWVEGRQGQAVTDPYFGDAEGFAATWADVTAAAAALVERMRRQGG